MVFVIGLNRLGGESSGTRKLDLLGQTPSKPCQLAALIQKFSGYNRANMVEWMARQGCSSVRRAGKERATCWLVAVCDYEVVGKRHLGRHEDTPELTT